MMTSVLPSNESAWSMPSSRSVTRCSAPGRSSAAVGSVTARMPPGAGVADPDAGVPGNGAVGSGVGESGVDGGVGVPWIVGGTGVAAGEAAGAVAVVVGIVTCGDGEAGATDVGVGDVGGGGVGATTTTAVVAVRGPGVASPHAATSHTPTATGVRTRANVRINGVAG